jgi:Mor family transcriptional regulator
MCWLRACEGMTLRQIGERYDLSPQRVRQLLRLYLGETDALALTAAALLCRQEQKLAREREQTDAILAAWRRGEQIGTIAKRLRVRYRSVRALIATRASDEDRPSASPCARQMDELGLVAL